MFEFLIPGEAFVFEFGASEVDEQANFDPRGVQIIDDLCLVFGSDGFDSFQLDNHLLFNEKIGKKVAHAFTPKYHLDRMLGYS